jgi:hypothetical protein
VSAVVNSDGPTVIYAKATDPAGNVSSCTNLVTYNNDSTAPVVGNVTSSLANGSYKVGQVIPVNLTFSEPVTVTGSPQITLETGVTDSLVNYTTGSGTTTLTFNYTVSPGDTTADLDYLSTSALALNGGTIKDAVGNNATLTLPQVGGIASISGQKAIVVDTTSPTVSYLSITPASPGATRTPTVGVSVSEVASSLRLYTDASCGNPASNAASGVAGANSIITINLTNVNKVTRNPKGLKKNVRLLLRVGPENFCPNYRDYPN